MIIAEFGGVIFGKVQISIDVRTTQVKIVKTFKTLSKTFRVSDHVVRLRTSSYIGRPNIDCPTPKVRGRRCVAVGVFD